MNEPDEAIAVTPQSQDLAQVVIDIVTNDAAIDVMKDVAQEALRGIVSGTLEEVPIVSGFVAMLKAVGVVHNAFLLRKLSKFLTALEEIPETQRREMIARLEIDSEYNKKVGEHVLEFLERMESQRKPFMAGLIFAALARGDIDHSLLQRLLNVVEIIHSYEIDRVRKWADTTPGEDYAKLDRESLQAYANSGLAVVESYAGGLGHNPNGTCRKFLELRLDWLSKDR